MFGTWIGWIVKAFDYINRVLITLPLMVYEGTWTILFPLAPLGKGRGLQLGLGILVGLPL